MRPPIPSMIFSRRAKIALAVVVILIVLLILAVKLAGVYVNYLWFGSLGHRNVYTTIFWTKVSLFLIFGVLMALIIGGNLVIAYLIKPPFRPMSPEQQNLQHYVAMVEPRRKWVLALAVVISFLAAGASAQGDWAKWQLWLNGGSFGVKDPQFHKDISFYAFDYPVYRTMLGFGFTAIIFSIVLCVIVHYLTGAIRLQTPGPKVTLTARRHLTILVFVFMILKAIAYWLDRYGFVFSDRSKFTGASYTDVHSALPAKTILFWVAIILAIGVLASMWLKSVLLPGVGFVVLLIMSILIGGIYPAIVQRFTVKPNASDKEAPYILKNINSTRQAYDIVTSNGKNGGNVTYVPYNNASRTPSAASVGQSNATTNNIRILDPNVVSPTFLNAQKIGRPYTFSPTLDVDRYTINGVEHDYVVGVRELAPDANLGGAGAQQNNWINLHTVYTHGYGFVAAQADTDITANNEAADYTEGGIPPTGQLNNTQPAVYYGQGMPDYSIVGAKGKQREYNGNNNPNVTYAGPGGVKLSNPFTKLAFAVKYRETNFILNDAVGASGAKIIFNRDPKTELAKVAPFLTVDGDPYPVVDQKTGHIVWMLDGYTTTANYPYSQRQSLSQLTHTSLRPGQKDTQINYIRNSVKATVDAYTGKVHLYDWDTSDPMLKAWMKVFPKLVLPKADMPKELLSHVRYPQDLFDVQRGLLAQYHISNPVASYNGNGTWAVPADPFDDTGALQPSYYVLADPPGTTSTKPQFQLTTPMVVNQATNLAAYMSVDSDDTSNYGHITVLQMPGKSNIQGPSQIANVFKSNATISKDISLLSQGQSQVLHGNLLTLPLGSSFLYVEPLYVQSSSTSSAAYPTLQRVLATYGDKIGYGATLEAALDDITGGRDPGSSLTPGQTVTPTKPPTPPSPSATSGASGTSGTSSSSPPSASNPTSVDQILTQLDKARSNLNAAYDSKDPVKIAQAQQVEQELIAKLLAATTPPAATPGRTSPTPTSSRSSPR